MLVFVTELYSIFLTVQEVSLLESMSKAKILKNGQWQCSIMQQMRHLGLFFLQHLGHPIILISHHSRVPIYGMVFAYTL